MSCALISKNHMQNIQTCEIYCFSQLQSIKFSIWTRKQERKITISLRIQTRNGAIKKFALLVVTTFIKKKSKPRECSNYSDQKTR